MIDSAERLGECPLWDERSQVLPEPVGSIAFRAKGGLLAKPAAHELTHRFNDGRCDRAGRF